MQILIAPIRSYNKTVLSLVAPLLELQFFTVAFGLTSGFFTSEFRVGKSLGANSTLVVLKRSIKISDDSVDKTPTKHWYCLRLSMSAPYGILELPLSPISLSSTIHYQTGCISIYIKTLFGVIQTLRFDNEWLKSNGA